MAGDKTRPAGSPVHIMLVAGEPSGDRLGAELIATLKETASNSSGGLIFSGVGGAAMKAEGLKSLFDLQDIAVMGIAEILPKLPLILKRLQETADAVVNTHPDALVIIDSPDFTHRLAKQVARRSPEIPIIDYVAPQVWAWRKDRARVMGRYIDHLLTLLPFEKNFFESAGLQTTFVGHPAVGRAASQEVAQKFRADHKIAPSAPVLLLLPGSRKSEIDRHIDIFGQAAMALAQDVGGLEIVLPTLAHLRDPLRARASKWRLPVHLVSGEESAAAMKAGNVALAASGTVSLELAAAGVPMVIGYRVNPLTALVYRLAVRLSSVVLFNLVAGENVVPELLQGRLNPQNASQALRHLLNDAPARARQLAAAARVVAQLSSGDESPSRNAAHAIWATLAAAKADSQTLGDQ